MKTTRTLYTILVLLVAFLHIQSQEVLIDEKPAHPYTSTNWGSNRTNHLQLVIGFGHHLPLENNIIANKLIGTYNLAAWIQYKRKFTPVIALLLSGGVEQNRMALASDIFPPSVSNLSSENEWLRLDWASGIALFRFNFDKKRGNYLGEYCDIGVFYNYLLASRHVIINTFTPGNASFNKQKTILKGLHDINNQRWGFALRLGFNTLALQYLLQLSEPIFTFNNSISFPIHQVGLTIAIPR